MSERYASPFVLAEIDDFVAKLAGEASELDLLEEVSRVHTHSSRSTVTGSPRPRG
jgi:hypothetical protein